MIPQFAPDNIIRIDYNIIKNKDIFALKIIGAHNEQPIPYKEDVYAAINDENCIYVAQSGNDTTGDGTASNPFKTLQKAFSRVTYEKIYICILDSNTYNEDLNYDAALISLADITAAENQTPMYCNHTYSFEINDTNCCFVASTGSDTTGNGSRNNPYKTIYHANGVTDKEYIIILDNETYEEKTLIFTPTVKGISADIGKRPIVKMKKYFNEDNYNLSLAFEKKFRDTNSYDNNPPLLLPMKTGYFLMVWTYDSGSPVIRYMIIDKNGNDVYGLQTKTRYEVGDQVDGVVTDNYVYIIEFTGSSDKKTYITKFNHSGTRLETRYFSSPEYGDRGIGRIGQYLILTGRYNDYDSKYLIFDENFNVIQNWTALGYNLEYGGSAYGSTILPTPDGGAIMYGRKGSGITSGCIIKIGSDYKPAGYTVIDNIRSTTMSGNVVGDKFILMYNKADGKLYVREYSAANLTIIKSETEIVSSNVPTLMYNGDLKIDTNGNYIYSGADGGYTSGNGATYIFNNDYELIKKITYTTNMGGGSGAYNKYSNTFLSLGWISSTYKLNIAGITGFNFDFIKSANKKLLIQGINFDGSSIQGYRYYINHTNTDSDSEITIKNNNFKNIVKTDDSSMPSNIIYSNAKNIIYTNNLFVENDNVITSNTQNGVVTINHNIFAYNGNNTAKYAIECDATGTTFEINHNDFIYNYGSIKINNNSTDIVLKNNILYQNPAGIYLGNSGVTLFNSINIDAYTNLALDTTVLAANPLYHDVGLQDRNNIDLNLKNRLIGYSLDSPAIRIADDSTNAGSKLCLYIGTNETYQQVTLPKPNTIKINYAAINPTVNIKTAYATREGNYYEIIMLWNSLLNEDVEKILNIYSATNYKIKVYYNPITAPTIYEIYSLVYDTGINLSSVYSLMDDIGRVNVQLKMIRRG